MLKKRFNNKTTISKIIKGRGHDAGRISGDSRKRAGRNANGCRKNNLWENLQGFRYAHRGLFHEPRSASSKVLLPFAPPLWREDIALWKAAGKKIIPENSMRAFRMAVRHGFGSELDVHLTADGRLVVFHDTNLVRMTGIDCRIEEMTWPQLKRVRLLDTGCRIPLLEEVLDLYTSPKALTRKVDARLNTSSDGKSASPEVMSRDNSQSAPQNDSGLLHLPLIIELKAEKNVSALCSHVMEMVDRYPSLNYCLESFDPRVVYWLRRHRPDVIRGQLTENFMKSKEAVRQWGHLMTFGMWSVAPDLLSRPDFIASKFPDRKNIFILLSHRLGVRQVNWVIKNREELLQVEREGGLGIFERFVPDMI